MPKRAIRHGVIGRLAGQVRRTGWQTVPARTAVLTVLTAACAIGVIVGARLTGAASPAASGPPSPARASSSATSRSAARAAGHAQAAGLGATGRGRDAREADRTGPLRTSCRAVAHIGDSTSEGLVSSDYLPNPAQRIPAQYRDVGVHTVDTNISGARSVVEVLPGQVNGYDAALDLARAGFSGCWVLALGTDDTADVAAGSLVSLRTRIARMMSAARGEPVMWVSVISLVRSGPYAEANMMRWNRALQRACARYPDMRIFDWASLARRRWFISDGIHYTSAGYAARARLIAQALARAFPRQGHSPGCVVR